MINRRLSRTKIYEVLIFLLWNPSKMKQPRFFTNERVYIIEKKQCCIFCIQLSKVRIFNCKIITVFPSLFACQFSLVKCLAWIIKFTFGFHCTDPLPRVEGVLCLVAPQLSEVPCMREFECKSIKDCVIYFLADRQWMMVEDESTYKKVNVREPERMPRAFRRRRQIETLEKIFAKQNPVRTVINLQFSLNHNTDVFILRIFFEPFYGQTMVFGD